MGWFSKSDEEKRNERKEMLSKYKSELEMYKKKYQEYQWAGSSEDEEVNKLQLEIANYKSLTNSYFPQKLAESLGWPFFCLEGVTKRLYVCDNSVVIATSSMLAATVNGYIKVIPIDKITSIQISTYNLVTKGYIEISTSGGDDNSTSGLTQTGENNITYKDGDPARVANAIFQYLLSRIQKKQEKA